MEIKDGVLTGGYIGEIVDGNKKAEYLKELAKLEGIDINQTIAVGDGANDLPMINLAGLGIAFHAKPKVKDNAQSSIVITSYSIHYTKLYDIVDAVLEYKKEYFDSSSSEKNYTVSKDKNDTVKTTTTSDKGITFKVQIAASGRNVITSYSIHYTKLYEVGILSRI